MFIGCASQWLPPIVVEIIVILVCGSGIRSLLPIAIDANINSLESESDFIQ